MYNRYYGGDTVTVYADVLITVNTFVNFFILHLCAWINRQKCKGVRLVLGALSGGICALSIFLPTDSIIIDLLIKIITASIMVIVSFGFGKIKIFLRNVTILFLTTYLFAGITFGVWFVFRPQNIIINNSVVYFDISVTFLVVITAISYFLITVISSLLKKEAITAKRCRVKLYLHKKHIELDAIFDTGNSLHDPFGNSEIVTVGENKLLELCKSNLESEYLSDRYRLLPCRTVSGDTLLEGIRCDSLEIKFDDKTYVSKNPIAVISKTEFNDDFDAVLNSEILSKLR